MVFVIETVTVTMTMTLTMTLTVTVTLTMTVTVTVTMTLTLTVALTLTVTLTVALTLTLTLTVYAIAALLIAFAGSLNLLDYRTLQDIISAWVSKFFLVPFCRGAPNGAQKFECSSAEAGRSRRQITQRSEGESGAAQRQKRRQTLASSRTCSALQFQALV